MNVVTSLSRFIEDSTSEHMPDAAAQLVELLESDEVEPIGAPGEPVLAEDVADRLESQLQKAKDRVNGDDAARLIEDAVQHLRAVEGSTLEPWSFEDSDGVRWFVLADEDEDIVACYTSAAFVRAER